MWHVPDKEDKECKIVLTKQILLGDREGERERVHETHEKQKYMKNKTLPIGEQKTKANPKMGAMPISYP